MDDEGDFIELVKFRLSSLGCEFLVANDGVQALSQARQFKPNLILLDIFVYTLKNEPFYERAQEALKKAKKE